MGRCVADDQFGPYRLEALLGRGGMGEVYRAFDTVRRRTVALKRLSPGLAADEDFQHRFRRESELAARLRDPHVIPIHDFGEIDGQLFIDMRLVDGRDMLSALGDRGPFAPMQAARLVAQVASALEAAHVDGLVHRDVKPSNILLTGPVGNEFAYLIDFGIARNLDSTQTVGPTIGTLAYMAPERFETPPVNDKHGDIYALACVLFEALTARRPFPVEDLPALIFAHLHTEPPRPSAVRSNVPTGLDAVVARGMAKSITARYQSALALGDAARLAVETAAPTTPRADAVTVPSAIGPVGSTVILDPAPDPRADVSDSVAASELVQRGPTKTILLATLIVLTAAAAAVGVVVTNGDDPTQRPSTEPGFHSLTPARLLDTSGGSGRGGLAPDGRLNPSVLNANGVPSTNVDAVLLSVTATAGAGGASVSVYRTGDERPAIANLFVDPGQTAADLVVTRPSADGTVTIYNDSRSAVQLTADVTGYFSGGAASTFQPLPVRTVFNSAQPGAAFPLDAKQAVKMAGQGGVPDDGTAAAVLVNVSAESDVPGWLGAYPTGRAPSAEEKEYPTALDYPGGGRQTANLSVLPIGAGGRITIFNKTQNHLAGQLDVQLQIVGYFRTAGGAAGAFDPGQRPAVLLNTTNSMSGQNKKLVPHEVRRIYLGDHVADDCTSAVLAVHAQADGPGRLSVSPSGGPAYPPQIAVPADPHVTAATLVIVRIGTDRFVEVRNDSAGETNLYVDLQGCFTGAG